MKKGVKVLAVACSMEGVSRRKKKREEEKEESALPNAFGALDGLGGLPAGPQGDLEEASKRGKKNMKRGRVDIVRSTAHRGGKAVTVVKNFKGIGLPEKQELAKKIQKSCGCGGTVKDGCIEIQGDKREQVKQILEEAGFQPVFAGG